MMDPLRRTTAADDERAMISETEQRLVDRYRAEGIAPDEVRLAVGEAFERLADARVRSFLPILVERSVRLRLLDAA